MVTPRRLSSISHYIRCKDHNDTITSGKWHWKVFLEIGNDVIKEGEVNTILGDGKWGVYQKETEAIMYSSSMILDYGVWYRYPEE